VVALLLYAYARGNRSSWGIERACREDVTYKVITAMRVPDHSTIAEFRRRHERALAELFTEVLALCDEAGLVEVGVISIDGMKVRANASRGANRTYEKLVADIFKEAEETDRWEDELFGEDRGDEVPEHLRSEEGRRAAFRAARERLEQRAGRGKEPEVAQFAANAGGNVIANVRDDDAERMRDYGATETIDHTKVPLPDAVRQAHPDGIDALLDVVSDAPTLPCSPRW
jgi:Transposase domain (DUF772)